MRKTILLLLQKENLKGANEKKRVFPLQDEESSVPSSSSTDVQHKII
jgi:hypothetical protein